MAAVAGLVSVAEIAKLLGVSRRTAQRYTGRDDFPEPEERLAIGTIWSRSNVERWARRTLPLVEGAAAHRRNA
jgi:predicted DNA-binding transcriptional regulator AlpA